MKAFTPLEGFRLACKGARESWVILLMHSPCPTPSLMQPPTAAIPVFRGGREVLSYLFQLLRGVSSLSALHPLAAWVSEDSCAIRIFFVGILLLLFLYVGRERVPGKLTLP